MYNKVILIGRLTKDPDVRVTSTGTPVATFTLAVNRTYNKEETDFINCVTWRKTAEIVGQYLSKGSLISVEGRIQNRSYDTDNGKRYITEVICDNVVFLDTKGNDHQTVKPAQVADVKFDDKNMDISSDDLPF